MSKIVFSNHIATISEQELIPGFPIINISHANCQAQVSLYGGHVLSWQPVEQHPVFWLSDTALFEAGKAIRGGIPLCWPWFGPLEGTNQHGFARQVLWKLGSVEVNEEGVKIIVVWQGEEMNPLWPNACQLKQTLWFGQRFEQALAMSNLSDQPVQYTGALHTYFRVSDPEKVTVPTLDNSPSFDKLTDQTVPPKKRDNCVGPIDSVYQCDTPQRIFDQGWQREIRVTNSATKQWVLWNPGKEIADNMADIHPHGEQEYVCLEAANTQWQTIAPHSTMVIAQKIEISAL